MIQLRVKFLIFIAFFGTVLFINYKTQDDIGLKAGKIVGSSAKGSSNGPTVSEFESNPEYISKVADEAKKVLNNIRETTMSVVSPDPKFEIAQRKFGQVHASKEAKKMFLDKAFLKFDFPPGFSFVEMPSERDDMIILHGRDDKNLAEFSIFASEYVPTEEELFEFLSEKATVPTIGDGLQEIKKIRTVQSNEGSGLKQISIYQSRNSNFVNTYVAWVPRRDNAGNYLFLLSADQKYIDKTEDYFDGIKDRMKAIDVP